jgi:hypothetical protein
LFDDLLLPLFLVLGATTVVHRRDCKTRISHLSRKRYMPTVFGSDEVRIEYGGIRLRSERRPDDADLAGERSMIR